MAEIILVEDQLTESALTCVAIALRRPGTQVAEVRDLRGAKALIQADPAGAPLVILGWRALRNGLEPFFNAIGGHATVVGFADEIGASARARALQAGVRRIYHKPAEWNAFAAAVEGMLADWSTFPAKTAAR
jgi:DNA-binding response OmpR family regulator